MSSAAAQPLGFADVVERVKPSVISVKVTTKDKTADTSNNNDDDEIGLTDGAFLSSVRRPEWRISKSRA